jgi:pimeloyl-ACP methyl ester carboxylesterase
MTGLRNTRLSVASDGEARAIAMLSRAGGSPGLFWLGGFRSEMTGSKATAIDAFGAAEGLMVTRFDYSGHGQSGGAFRDGTISRWLAEALAVFATTTGEQIVIGSSMGGWLALLLNRALRARGEQRVKALILIAPAVDMTAELMRANFTPEDFDALASSGQIERPSAYSAEPDIITARLIEDGERHLLFGGTIETGCPVTILQGGQDQDVPQEHAMKLVARLLTDPVTLTVIPDGDHRLSREADLQLLINAVRRAIEE